MSGSVNEIHVTNWTGLTLSDRFTTVQDRRRDVPEQCVLRPAASRDTSIANRRLLQQLDRKHELKVALKPKRRSMRPIGGNIAMRRGTIKALRVAANGKPMRTNSLTTVAIMKTDLITNSQRTTNRPQRRANSVSNRLGSRRPMVGGAAQRIAQRRLQHRPMQGTDMMNEMQRRGRSRSRSRAPVASINLTRSRSRSAGHGGVPMLSQIRSRSRSRQRSRSRAHAVARSHLPIKARLGVRAYANENIQVRAQSRARSRTRGGSVSDQRNGGSGQGERIRRRSQLGGRGTQAQRKGNANGNKNGQRQQQQQSRRGRSRSRGGRNQGKTVKPGVHKEKLDNELDQYMYGHTD